MPLIATDVELINALRRNWRVDANGGTRGSLHELSMRGVEILARNPSRIADPEFVHEVVQIGYAGGMISDWQMYLPRFVDNENDLIRELSSMRRQNEEGVDNRAVTEDLLQYFLVENRLIRSQRLYSVITEIVGANMLSLAAGNIDLLDNDLEIAMNTLTELSDDGIEQAGTTLALIEDSIYSAVMEYDLYEVFRHGMFTDHVREAYGYDFLVQLAARVDAQLEADEQMPLIVKQPDGFRCSGGIYITYLEAARQAIRVGDRRTSVADTSREGPIPIVYGNTPDSVSLRVFGEDMIRAAMGAIANAPGLREALALPSQEETNEQARERRMLLGEAVPPLMERVQMPSRIFMARENAIAENPLRTIRQELSVGGSMFEVISDEYGRELSRRELDRDSPFQEGAVRIASHIAETLLNEPRFKLGDVRTNDRGEMEVYMHPDTGRGAGYFTPVWVKVTPTAETKVNAVRVLLNLANLNAIKNVQVYFNDGSNKVLSPEALLAMAVNGCADIHDIKASLQKHEQSRNQAIADFVFWQARIGKYVRAKFNPMINSPEAPLSGKEFIWQVRSAHYKCRTDEERRSPLGLELARQLGDTQMGPTLYTMVTHVADISNEEFEVLRRAHAPKRRINIDD